MTNRIRILILTGTHAAAIVVGFALGIYALPILTAPESPSVELVRSAAAAARFQGEFRRDLEDSDTFHWGEGEVSIGADSISLQGTLSPGPAYKLYLSPEFVETETDFLRLKPKMVRVGDVTTFDNFMVPVPEDVDLNDFNTVIVWCESFGQFITAARYR